MSYSIRKRIAKDGTKSYQVRHRGPDKKVRSKTFGRKVDAVKWGKDQDTEMARGSWIDPTGAETTFGEWWATYNAQAPKRTSTRVRDQGAAEHWLLPDLEDMPLGAITPTTVRGIVAAMENGGLASSTVRTYYGVLRAALNAAVDADLIARSPIRRGQVSGGDRRADPRFLSMPELRRLAEAIDPNYRAMVYLAGIVGLRFGECAGLRVGRINFFGPTVTVAEIANDVQGGILFGPPKTKASRRTVKLPRYVADELSRHLRGRAPVEPDDLVFTAPNGGPLSRKSWRNRFWKPAVREADLEGLTFHGLRHSAAGFMIELGTHPRVMQVRMGHAEYRTTMDHYGSVLPQVDADVVDGLDDLIDGEDDGDIEGEVEGL